MPHNIGSQGIPNNEGIKRAKGEYIAYLSHDDLWFPWHLEQLLQHLLTSDCDWVHSSGFAILPNFKIEFTGSLPIGFDYQSYFISPSLWLHQLNILETAGYWPHHNQAYTYLDQDLQIKITKTGFKMGSSGEPSVLKFYAKEWKILSRSTDYFPQKIYFEKIVANPQALQLELLKQIADQYGHEIYNRYWGGFSSLEALKILLWRPFRRRVIWPAQNNIPWVKKIMTWKMLRFRQRRAIQTGEAEHK